MRTFYNKPKNWQDFEVLCYHLWKKEFKCSIINLHGRQGQPQHGVDVYGVKENGEYFGIQCKGKDEYNHAKLTYQEIDSEVEKANNFAPKISLFVFATTASRDTHIQEYIREKDIEIFPKYGFHIDVKFWKDIEEMLDFHKEVSEWYMGNTSSLRESAIKRVKDEKKGKRLAQKLLGDDLPKSREFWSRLLYHPNEKFKYDKVLVQSIYDELYPELDENNCDSWRIDCLYDYSESEGLKMSTTYATGIKIYLDKDGNCGYAEDKTPEFLNGKYVILVDEICTIRFENIIDIEEDGDDIHNMPIIRVAPDSNGHLYSKVEYVYSSFEKHVQINLTLGKDVVIPLDDLAKLPIYDASKDTDY